MTFGSEQLEDTQSRKDRREVPLQSVGVKGVILPFQIKVKDDGHQTVLANVDLFANLPHYFKGTHMSRFMEILEEWRNRPVSDPEIRKILSQTRTLLEAETAHISIKFKYFIEKQAPVSGITGILGYDSAFIGDMSEEGLVTRLGVSVPVTTVCPCSQAISEVGAHNQRATIRARVRFVPGKFVWIEDLVRILEQQGSMEIFPILKREDEKYVTEHAFRNPKFVEDVVRDCVLDLRQDERIKWFSVECEAEESIHQHNAFACEEESL